jgi:hypothetical protein
VALVAYEGTFSQSIPGPCFQHPNKLLHCCIHHKKKPGVRALDFEYLPLYLDHYKKPRNFQRTYAAEIWAKASRKKSASCSGSFALTLNSATSSNVKAISINGSI